MSDDGGIGRGFGRSGECRSGFCMRVFGLQLAELELQLLWLLRQLQHAELWPAVAVWRGDELGDAVALRRADDRGKVDGLVVDGLAAWMELVRRVAVSVA